jgi:hypothetical protein
MLIYDTWLVRRQAVRGRNSKYGIKFSKANLRKYECCNIHHESLQNGYNGGAASSLGYYGGVEARDSHYVGNTHT